MATKYGTAKEIDSSRRELESLNVVASDPFRFGSIQDKGEFNKRKSSLERKLARITPPAPANDAERKVLEHRAGVLESFIKGRVNGTNLPAMPTKADQWEQPTGSVGNHIRHENKIKHMTVDAKGNVVKATDGYGAGFEWKDIQSRLTPLEEQLQDPDVRNLGKLRSQSTAGQSLIDRKRMNFAQGAGVSADQYNEAVGIESETPAKRDRKTRGKPVLTEANQCTDTKADGSRCKGIRMRGKDYCIGHSRKHKAA